jgi:glycosyltransferase involved in cell wall biosynthesis
MIRVLHLLDRHPDYSSQTAVAQLTREPSSADIITVGRGGTYTNPWIGTLRLRQRGAPCDLIHAWGMQPLTTAALGSNRPIVFSPNRYPTSSDLRWLRAVMSVRDVHVVCDSDTLRRGFVEKGVPIEHCHLIRPGVDFALVNRRRTDTEALREKLGFGPEAVIVLACGECVRGSNQQATILTATVLNVYDPKFKLLVWGRGPITQGSRRFASLMLPRNFIRFGTSWLGKGIMFEQLLPLASAMFITADHPVPTLPIATAMAAGVPIVAVVSPTVAELLEDRHTALMHFEPRARILARKALEIVEEDAHLRWKLTDTARSEAYEYFSMTRFVSQMNSLYEQVVSGKSVEIIQPSPGASARFAGKI